MFYSQSESVSESHWLSFNFARFLKLKCPTSLCTRSRTPWWRAPWRSRCNTSSDHLLTDHAHEAISCSPELCDWNKGVGKSSCILSLHSNWTVNKSIRAFCFLATSINGYNAGKIPHVFPHFTRFCSRTPAFPHFTKSHPVLGGLAHLVFLSDVLNDVIGVTSNCRPCSIQLPYAILPRLRFTACVFSKAENLGRFFMIHPVYSFSARTLIVRLW